MSKVWQAATRDVSSFYRPAWPGGGAALPWSSARATAQANLRQKCDGALSVVARVTRPVVRPLSRPAARFLQVTAKLFKATEKRPLTVGAITAGLLGSVGDAVSQKYYGGQFDWKRNIIFGIHGTLYIGIFQYMLWNCCFTTVTGMLCKTASTATALMVGMDLLLHIPFIYFPIFYCMKEVMQKNKMNKEVVKTALTKWRTNLEEDVKACWGMWAPIQAITFSVVPLHLRVPFVAVVNFCWTVILSTMRGDT